MSKFLPQEHKNGDLYTRGVLALPETPFVGVDVDFAGMADAPLEVADLFGERVHPEEVTDLRAHLPLPIPDRSSVF